jgi:hypothetical protein
VGDGTLVPTEDVEASHGIVSALSCSHIRAHLPKCRRTLTDDSSKFRATACLRQRGAERGSLYRRSSNTEP